MDEYIEWCDDCERFHRYFIHYEADGPVTTDSDGNAVDVTRDNGRPWVPETDEEWKQLEENWAKYYRKVASTGDDYLGLLAASVPVARAQRWQVMFFREIRGVRVFARKRGRGQWVAGPSLPQHVRQYLDLDDTGILADTRYPDGEWHGRDGKSALQRIREGTSEDPRIEWRDTPLHSIDGRNAIWAWCVIDGPRIGPSKTAVKRAAREVLAHQKAVAEARGMEEDSDSIADEIAALTADGLEGDDLDAAVRDIVKGRTSEHE